MDFREFVETGKRWQAKRAEIVKFWQGLQPNLPLNINPVPLYHKGSRFDTDGIRITGSSDYINAVLSRLKDIINYERYPGFKLDMEYRQVPNKSNEINAKPVYAFYVYLVHDKHNKKKVF